MHDGGWKRENKFMITLKAEVMRYWYKLDELF